MDTTTINLILQIVLLLVGALIAYLIRKGVIDRKDLADTKDIAGALASSVEKMKTDAPEAAKQLTDAIVERIGDKKPELDAFLSKLNLNPPTDGE